MNYESSVEKLVFARTSCHVASRGHKNHSSFIGHVFHASRDLETLLFSHIT